jgi:hypothetical protein
MLHMLHTLHMFNTLHMLHMLHTLHMFNTLHMLHKCPFTLIRHKRNNALVCCGTAGKVVITD